jgi:serine/threonine-protein kinase HipA
VTNLAAINSLSSIEVRMMDRLVGHLAETRDGVFAFQYEREWLSDGFSISPRSLPLDSRVFVPKEMPFEGIWGVFNDSLPDGWGRLLVDRFLAKNGLLPEQINPLARLAIVGDSGMGALSYHPSVNWQNEHQTSNLDCLAAECAAVLTSGNTDNLDELFSLGAPSGGARPKILTKVGSEDWIIKFPASSDGVDSGKMEYQYMLAAKACGIEIPDVKLLVTDKQNSYFGIKRFDRNSRINCKTGKLDKIHMATASGLLEASHRYPSLSYETLLRWTLMLTGSLYEVEKLFRLACFNVFSGNRDDHAKNFSYLYSINDAKWHLAPAYDLTHNLGMAGEHATTVNGKGTGISTEDLAMLAKTAGIKKSSYLNIIETISETVTKELSVYLH